MPIQTTRGLGGMGLWLLYFVSVHMGLSVCVRTHTCAHPCVLLYVCSVVVSPHHGRLMFGVQLAMWS